MAKTMKKRIIDQVIEDAAAEGLKQYNIKPSEIMAFQYFQMGFFETPRKCKGKNWHYLRDPGTHSAIVFNVKTKEMILNQGEYYWPKSFFGPCKREVKEFKAWVKKQPRVSYK